jgi:hypothetical protein
MSCCGKKRKAADPRRPTLASPIGLLKPGRLDQSPSPTSRPGDARRDAAVTTER